MERGFLDRVSSGGSTSLFNNLITPKEVTDRLEVIEDSVYGLDKDAEWADCSTGLPYIDVSSILGPSVSGMTFWVSYLHYYELLSVAVEQARQIG
jgi:hypothetical protein